MNSNAASTGVPLLASVLVLVSSACCIGPLAIVLSLVGLSGSTLLAIENVVGPFRPLILTLTVAFLVTGFYFAYRRQEVSCEDGKICARPGSQRIQKILLWSATGLFLVLLYFTYVHPNLDILFGIY